MAPPGRRLFLVSMLPWAPVLAGIVLHATDEDFWWALPAVLLALLEWPVSVIAVAARSAPLGTQIVWVRALLVFVLGLALRLLAVGLVLLGMIET